MSDTDSAMKIPHEDDLDVIGTEFTSGVVQMKRFSEVLDEITIFWRNLKNNLNKMTL